MAAEIIFKSEGRSRTLATPTGFCAGSGTSNVMCSWIPGRKRWTKRVVDTHNKNSRLRTSGRPSGEPVELGYHSVNFLKMLVLCAYGDLAAPSTGSNTRSAIWDWSRLHERT